MSLHSEKCALLSPGAPKRRSSSPAHTGLFVHHPRNRRSPSLHPPVVAATSSSSQDTLVVTSHSGNQRYYSASPNAQVKLAPISSECSAGTHRNNSSSAETTDWPQSQLDTCKLRTSVSSPHEFLSHSERRRRSLFQPIMSMLERSGIINGRKLSFDSAALSANAQTNSGRLGANNFDTSLCTVSLIEASPVHSVSAHTSLASASKCFKPNCNPNIAMTHSPSHARLPGGLTSPVPEAKNPLYEVSNEYMRVSGYVQQFNRLLSVKKPHSSATDKPPEKGIEIVDVHKDTVANGSSANGMKPSQGSAYGRLWREPPNLKRFKKRKALLSQRTRACNFCLLFAFAGITLTIFEAELVANKHIAKVDFVSQFLRASCVGTTVILLCFIVWYHATEIKLCVIDSGAHDWRVAVTPDRLFPLCLELVICAVCPFPNTFQINWIVLLDDHRRIKTVPIPLDVVLSIPMFLRFYLICRFMALHSRQFQDAATRSIASLNRVTVNFTFVLKTQMHEHPLLVLCGFTISFWIVMAWLLTQCERFDDVPEDNHYLNALWFIMITFKSVGYGDLVPNTYCGRVLAITTGIVGAAVSSALIAVIGKKLELSRAEKHVNNFMTDSKLTRLRKDTAAMVLQQTWFIHKYREIKTAKDEMKLRFHQRKFLSAINEFRKVKWDQRKLAEQGNALVDLAKLQNDMHTMIFTMQQTLDHLTSQMSTLSYHVNQLHQLSLLRSAELSSPLMVGSVEQLPPKKTDIS